MWLILRGNRKPFVEKEKKEKKKREAYEGKEKNQARSRKASPALSCYAIARRKFRGSCRKPKHSTRILRLISSVVL